MKKTSKFRKSKSKNAIAETSNNNDGGKSKDPNSKDPPRAVSQRKSKSTNHGLLFKPRNADSEFMHQFQNSGYFTSLEHLKNVLQKKIHEQHMQGLIMIHKKLETGPLAVQLIQNFLKKTTATVPALEQYIQDITSNQLQEFIDIKQEEHDNLFKKHDKMIQNISTFILTRAGVEKRTHGQHLSIDESPHKHIYKKIERQQVDYKQSNRSLFKKCAHKSCKNNTFCSFEKMETVIDPTLNLNQPLIYGTNAYAMQLNQKFAQTDFPDRQLTMKNPQIKVVATEESLDDWHAQSLGITTEKLIKAKKYMQHFQASNRGDKKERGKESQGDGADALNDSGNEKVSKPKMVVGADLGHLISSQRPNGYSNPIKSMTDLKPKIYNQYHQVQSLALLGNQKPVKRIGTRKSIDKDAKESYKQQQKILKARKQAQAQSNQNQLMSPEDTDERKKEDHSRNTKSLSNFNSNKSYLMEEIGAFHSKQIYQKYLDEEKRSKEKIKESKLKQSESISNIRFKRLVPTKDLELFKKQKKEINTLLKQNENLEKQKQLRLKNQIQTSKSGQLNFYHTNKSQDALQTPVKLRNIFSGHPQNDAANTLKFDQESRTAKSLNRVPSKTGKKSKSNDRQQMVSRSQSEIINQLLNHNYTYSTVEYEEPLNIVDQLSKNVKDRLRSGGGPEDSSFKIINLNHTRELEQPQSVTYLHHNEYGELAAVGTQKTDQKLSSVSLKTNSQSQLTRKRFNINCYSATNLAAKKAAAMHKALWLRGGTSDLESIGNTDLTHNWHQRNHRQETLIDTTTNHDALTQFFSNKVKNLNESSLDAASGLQKHMSYENVPQMHLSTNETAFFQINREYRGLAASSEKARKLIRITQESCFKQQKKDFIGMVMNKAKFQPPNVNKDDTMKESKGSGENNRERPKGILDDEQKRKEFKNSILKQIENDNNDDIEGDFLAKEKDRRVYKVNMKCHDKGPSQQQLNQKHNFHAATFWYLKGYEHYHCKNNEVESAIDSYRQAIRLNPFYVDAMHNLACSYEEQQRFELGMQWFQRVIDLDPSNWDAYHGFALCAFKGGKPEIALEKLNKVIDQIQSHKRNNTASDGNKTLEKSSISASIEDNTRRKTLKEDSFADMQSRDDFRKLYYRYLRALCFKAIHNFDESQKDYCAINKAFEISEGKAFSKQIFAMVMMPLQVNRKSQLRFIETFEEILSRYEEDRDRKILAPHYIAFNDPAKQTVSPLLHRDNKHPKWLDKKLSEVVQTLQRLYFFRRFRIPRLLEFMDRMQLDIIDKKNLLFFEPDKVYVIVSGSILMKNHGKSTEKPDTLAKFGEGMILNFQQERMQTFNSIETWFMAQVETEVAIFDKKFFAKTWNEDIMTRDLLLKRSVLQAQPVFANISELTLMSLVSELFSERVFSKGEVILPQSQYSPTNKHTRAYFVAQDSSKFAERIKAKKLKSRKPQNASKSKSQSRKQSRMQSKHQSRRQSKSDARLKVTQSNSQDSGKSEKEKDKKEIEEMSLNDESESSDEQIIEDANDKSNQNTRQVVERQSSEKMNETKQDEQLQVDQKQKSVQIEKLKPDTCGFFLITEGKCRVENSEDGYSFQTLMNGHFFGEAEMLKCIDFCFFGDIIAETEVVKCLFMSNKEFMTIPTYERILIKQFAEQRSEINMLAMQYSRRYNVDPAEYQRFY